VIETAILDRSAPPGAGPSRPFEMQDFHHGDLGNGIEYRLIHCPTVPLVQIDVVTPGGGWYDPPGHSGLATLAANLLDEGTKTRSSLEIASEIDHLGGYLGSYAGWDCVEISATLLSRHLDRGLELVFDILTEPTFPDREVDRLRTQRIAEMQRRLSEPASLAVTALRRAIYGGGVYGCSLLGTPGSMGAIDRSQLTEFYKGHIATAGTTVIVAGDINVEHCSRILEEGLGSLCWPSPPDHPEIVAQPATEGRRVIVVDRPDASQTELRLGHATAVSRGHPELPSIQAMNALLGGKFTSRLNLNLRERHGFTYGVGSGFALRLGGGPFVISTSVANDVAGRAVEQVIIELERLRQEPPSTSEVEETVSYLRGVFPYTLQRMDDLAARLQVLAIHGLPRDHFSQYLEKLGELDPQRLFDTARSHLRPSQMLIVAVGPADTLREQLEAFGDVSTVRPEDADSLL